MEKTVINELEVDLFLDAIFRRWGYDFRSYARASLNRRVAQRLSITGLNQISDMIPLVLHDQSFFESFLTDMSVTVTEMFRDPWVFKKISETVIPKLRTYSRINIWHAGCATGAEVYSMAILLHEEGLLDRCQIYATDYNNKSLSLAKKGIFPINLMKAYTKNYIEAGGKSSFSDYYRTGYDSACIVKALRDRITFANHNLMNDGVFAEMNLVMCRNVMIYFDRTLQNQSLKLFSNSLVPRGFLVLGTQESLSYSDCNHEYESFESKERIYRRLAHV
ncbi:MAG: chemotaxis protein methyltransferase CheR [Candidatus Azotimanducaceae bacterium]|jgi:chemotaxis protein methyltransferase CheR